MLFFLIFRRKLEKPDTDCKREPFGVQMLRNLMVLACTSFCYDEDWAECFLLGLLKSNFVTGTEDAASNGVSAWNFLEILPQENFKRPPTLWLTSRVLSFENNFFSTPCCFICFLKSKSFMKEALVIRTFQKLHHCFF